MTIVKGRTTAQKHALIARVTQAVAESVDVPADRIRVAIHEVGPDDWGIGGVPYSTARSPHPAASDGES
ncbi:4-oxalocrotonate tautomerase family protein [Streptomyces sp. NPDC057199]|uniref:tautomerase family protein n=1 Tax=Streptomyces sp. NPDC057199 TaxID=3346047 RepID=UPI00362C4BD7